MASVKQTWAQTDRQMIVWCSCVTQWPTDSDSRAISEELAQMNDVNRRYTQKEQESMKAFVFMTADSRRDGSSRAPAQFSWNTAERCSVLTHSQQEQLIKYEFVLNSTYFMRKFKRFKWSESLVESPKTWINAMLWLIKQLKVKDRIQMDRLFFLTFKTYSFSLVRQRNCSKIKNKKQRKTFFLTIILQLFLRDINFFYRFFNSFEQFLNRFRVQIILTWECMEHH